MAHIAIGANYRMPASEFSGTEQGRDSLIPLAFPV